MPPVRTLPIVNPGPHWPDVGPEGETSMSVRLRSLTALLVTTSLAVGCAPATKPGQDPGRPTAYVWVNHGVLEYYAFFDTWNIVTLTEPDDLIVHDVVAELTAGGGCRSLGPHDVACPPADV